MYPQLMVLKQAWGCISSVVTVLVFRSINTIVAWARCKFREVHALDVSMAHGIPLSKVVSIEPS
jgi:hypothetical protein